MAKLITTLLCTLVCFFSATVFAQNRAETITVSSWNVFGANSLLHTHGRTDADWDRLAQLGNSLARNADVLLLQEFESVNYAERLFGDDFSYYFSSRGANGGSEGALLRTAIAVRDTALTVIDAYEYTPLGNNGGRHGIDLTLENLTTGNQFRVLNVHLDERCPEQATDNNINRISSCANLVDQYNEIRLWIQARVDEGAPFLVGGTILRDLINSNEFPFLGSGAENELIILNTGESPACWDGRYDFWSDYLLAHPSMQATYVSGSFRELMIRSEVGFDRDATKLSDQCPITAEFGI